MRIHEIIQENSALLKGAQLGAKNIPNTGAVDPFVKGIGTFFNSLGSGIADTTIRRAGLYALQGRTQEAEQLIRSSLKSADPAKLQKVLDYIRTVKPIPNATSAKLDANPQVTDWLNNKYLPWVQQATNTTKTAGQTTTAAATTAGQTVAPTVVKIAKFTDSGLDFVNMPTKIMINNTLTNVVSPVVNYEGRAIVIVKVDGKSMPFYCSSGGAPKEGVVPGKWYPVFGIGSDGWINKGTSAGIAQYYNVPALRQVAQQLDSKVGDVRNILSDSTKIGSAQADAIAVINQGRKPVTHSDGYDAFKANAMAQLKPFL